jgi:hypothetical protein
MTCLGKRFLGLALALWALVVAPGGPAQTLSALRAQERPDQAEKDARARVRTMRAWILVDELKLDEATSGRVFAIFARYDQREVALVAERRAIVDRLRAEVDAPRPDEARLARTLDQLLANRSRRCALGDERFNELRKLLSPIQQAKLLLLLPRLERDLARSIREGAADHTRGPPNQEHE